MTVETSDISGDPIVKSGPYNGNGVTDTFDYDFLISNEGEVLVTRQNADLTEDDLVLTTDYTVTGVGDPDGGTVVLVAPATSLTTGEKLVLRYNGDFNQATDYSNQGAIQLAQLEAALDKLTMHARQIKETLDRSVTVDAFGTVDITTLRSNISALALIETEITAVAAIVADITATAAIDTEIVTVVGLASEIVVLEGLAAEIAALDAISADITTVAGVAGAVADAAANAAAASASASAASASAGAAAASASAADASATEAALSAIAAGSNVGEVIQWPLGTAPSFALAADGSAVSRTTYSALFAIYGTTFGVGDGSTTFNLPDYRGVVLRGLDDGKGYDTGRAIGTYQADAFQGHGHNIEQDGTDGRSYAGTSGSNFDNEATGGTENNGYYGYEIFAENLKATDAETLGANGTPRIATETRMKNVSVLMCVRF